MPVGPAAPVAPVAPVTPLQIGSAPPSGNPSSTPPDTHCALMVGSVVAVTALPGAPLHTELTPPSDSCVNLTPPNGHGWPPAVMGVTTTELPGGPTTTPPSMTSTSPGGP